MCIKIRITNINKNPEKCTENVLNFSWCTEIKHKNVLMAKKNPDTVKYLDLVRI